MDERFNIKSMVAVGYTFHYNAAVPDGQHQPLQPLTVCQHCLGRGLIAPAMQRFSHMGKVSVISVVFFLK